ncbi:MAG: alcohol dehydrogenase catalytic domain-containing protein [Acidobacteria bacterium]|nr:alcohol dehydrogenase catalytic domain-containing protein [Acidobacteriota bacterium]
MRVARLHGPGDLRLHDEPRPTPAPGEVLVRVEAVGICGSDLHWFEEGSVGGVPLTRPLSPGHELAGRTEDGRRVAVDPAIPCDECSLCREGHPNLCPSVRFAGYGEDDGALREWMAWPERCLFPLPDALSTVDGAMLEPLGVALHAVDLAHLRPGMTVGVFGCGPIGLLALQVARLAGATRLIATDLPTRPHRLDAARALGAEAVPADAGREASTILELTGGRGLDAAIEAAGENPAVDAAVDAVRPGARVVLAGIPAEDRISFRASPARRKGLSLVLSRRMKHTYPRAIRLAEDGHVELRELVTGRFRLEKAGEAFASASTRDGLKVVVEI